MTVTIPDLLLFCIERSEYVYAFYFVERDTLDEGMPRLHRFTGRAALSRQLVAGGLYDVTVSGKRLLGAELIQEYIIATPYYNMLSELRALTYRGDSWHAEDYYDFREYRELLAFWPPSLRRAAEWAVKALFTLTAFAIPMAAYVLLAVFLFKNAKSPVAAPVIAVTALPLELFIIAAAYFGCRWLLASMEFTRNGLLRGFALRTCGARHAAGWNGLSARKKRLAAIWLIGAAALFLVSLFMLAL